MNGLLLAVCVAAAAAAAPPAVSPPQASEPYSRDWKRLRSAHFVAAGNADYASMRSVVAELEGFRRALLRSLPSLRVASAAPTTVVLFKDDASFARFRPLDENGRRRDRVAAYLLSGPAASYLVVPMHREAARTFHYAFHEYTHLIVRENLGGVPEWLNEGLAEFYSTFRVAPRERRAVLGEPPRNRLPALTSGGRLPLRDLLTMDRAARASAGAARQQAFYAQSWALVHFLTLGDGGRHRAGIAAYLAAVAKGAPVEAAVPAAFGLPLHELERAIASYSQRTSFPSLQLDEPEGAVAIRTTLEAMLERDVAALQRELQALLARVTAPHR